MCPKILKLKNASAKCKAACTAIEARVERRHVQIVSKHVGQRLAIRRRQQRGLLPQTAADILVDIIRAWEMNAFRPWKTAAITEMLALVRKDKRQ